MLAAHRGASFDPTTTYTQLLSCSHSACPTESRKILASTLLFRAIIYVRSEANQCIACIKKTHYQTVGKKSSFLKSIRERHLGTARTHYKGRALPTPQKRVSDKRKRKAEAVRSQQKQIPSIFKKKNGTKPQKLSKCHWHHLPQKKTDPSCREKKSEEKIYMFYLFFSEFPHTKKKKNFFFWALSRLGTLGVF